MTEDKRNSALEDAHFYEYTEKLKASALKKYGRAPRAFIHTYGCQGNVADSERIKGMLALAGYEFTDEAADADFILFNTCAVREHAEDRVFGNVGALKAKKRDDPSCIIALCGCMMQQQHIADKIKDSYKFVDLVFGTHVIHKLPEMLYSLVSRGGRIFETPDEKGSIVEGIPTVKDSKIKAWLPIMYGCNNFCSYCIVPYVRGRERSRSPETVIAEAKELVRAGYKEITLLGQNVNSYGKDLAEPYSFARLMREINAIEGDFIIRFMTSHPKDCTKELIDAMAECEKCARHLHLPFQSGSDRVLKEMNRRYTAEHYLSLIDYARSKMPDLSLTSDVIVGFPGETYEEFCETLELIKRVKFTSLFTFIYSPRKGTPAASMPDPVSREEKGVWFRELTSLQEEIAAERTAAMEGKIYRVLAEELTDDGFISGRTGGNVIIRFKGDENCVGSFADVKVTKALTWILEGEQVL